MKRMFRTTLVFLLSFIAMSGFGQKTISYDLPARLRNHLLDAAKPSSTIRMLDTATMPAISAKGLYWLAGAGFSEGSIEVDLRGNDILLKSFLGIAFYGVDSSTYDVVYFRPFNFRNQDTARHHWGVQYMSLPEFPYDQLRKEHPLTYEHAVDPVPYPNDWFHARIVVNRDSLLVYVNHSPNYCLKVPLLSMRHKGKIGIWSDAMPGDFANLKVTEINE